MLQCADCSRGGFTRNTELSGTQVHRCSIQHSIQQQQSAQGHPREHTKGVIAVRRTQTTSSSSCACSWGHSCSSRNQGSGTGVCAEWTDRSLSQNGHSQSSRSTVTRWHCSSCSPDSRCSISRLPYHRETETTERLRSIINVLGRLHQVTGLSEEHCQVCHVGCQQAEACCVLRVQGPHLMQACSLVLCCPPSTSGVSQPLPVWPRCHVRQPLAAEQVPCAGRRGLVCPGPQLHPGAEGGLRALPPACASACAVLAQQQKSRHFSLSCSLAPCSLPWRSLAKPSCLRSPSCLLRQNAPPPGPAPQS